MTNPNMADLANNLRNISASMPKMQAAAAKVSDLEKRLDNVEGTAAHAHDLAKRAANSGLEGIAAASRGRGLHDAHSRAFSAWLRAPQDSARMADLTTSEWDFRGEGSTLTGPGGGFAVPEPVADAINQRILEISPMRGLASVFQVTSTGTKFLVNRNDAASAWAGEADVRAATGEPTLDLRAPTFGTAHGLISATEELVHDSALDINSWFISAAAQKIAQAEGAAFVAGDGVNKPTGFLAGPTPLTTGDSTRAAGTLQYVPTGDAAALTLDGLQDTFFALKAAHRQAATWLMSSATGAALSKLRDADGRSIWQQSLAADAPSTLLGRPVAFDENMPAIAGDAFPIALGDFRQGYLIADSGGLRITVDDNITAPGRIRFYVRRRVGGVIYNSDAIKLLKIALS